MFLSGILGMSIGLIAVEMQLSKARAEKLSWVLFVWYCRQFDTDNRERISEIVHYGISIWTLFTSITLFVFFSQLVVVAVDGRIRSSKSDLTVRVVNLLINTFAGFPFRLIREGVYSACNTLLYAWVTIINGWTIWCIFVVDWLTPIGIEDHGGSV